MGDMYRFTCPSTDTEHHLHSADVISVHGSNSTKTVYLRCPCGQVVMWTSQHVFHPGAQPGRAPAVEVPLAS